MREGGEGMGGEGRGRKKDLTEGPRGQWSLNTAALSPKSMKTFVCIMITPDNSIVRSNATSLFPNSDTRVAAN